jgi:methylated-DNA-[protein]-cysteine S-methyltransferase
MPEIVAPRADGPARPEVTTMPQRTKVCRTIDSPVGLLTLAGDGTVLTNLRMVDQAHPPTDQDEWAPDDRAFPDVVEQLQAYFAGTLTDFDVPLRLEGTEFQRQVWAALLEIPYGDTWSYGELATHVGNPSASRAVGLANGKNPIGIIVPCHRVIGANGSLTGYGGGLDRKRALLELEQSRTQPRLALG